MANKKVLVSGCFDLLHNGHIAFLKTATQYGKLYVAVGKDSNLLLLKGKSPFFASVRPGTLAASKRMGQRFCLAKMFSLVELVGVIEFCGQI